MVGIVGLRGSRSLEIPSEIRPKSPSDDLRPSSARQEQLRQRVIEIAGGFVEAAEQLRSRLEEGLGSWSPRQAYGLHSTQVRYCGSSAEAGVIIAEAATDAPLPAKLLLKAPAGKQ